MDIKDLLQKYSEIDIENKKTQELQTSESIIPDCVCVRKYENYYDVSNTINVASSQNPEDPDSPVYNRERIYEILGRTSELLEVTNDGKDTLFIIVSHEGTVEFSKEARIFPGETKTYFNVYELRLRSPSQGLFYRVSEYDIRDTFQTTPIDIRDLTCERDHPDICDRADRILGIVQVSTPDNPINDFNQALSVPRDSTNTHIYTVTGNFKLSSIEVSASGSVKIEIRAGDINLETTRMIAFTSPSNPIAQLRFQEELQLTAGQRILVRRTNRENVPMDIFSTILGFNV